MGDRSSPAALDYGSLDRLWPSLTVGGRPSDQMPSAGFQWKKPTPTMLNGSPTRAGLPSSPSTFARPLTLPRSASLWTHETLAQFSNVQANLQVEGVDRRAPESGVEVQDAAGREVTARMVCPARAVVISTQGSNTISIDA